MQQQRRIQAIGAVVLIMGATLFVWAVLRRHADVQRLWGLFFGFFGQAAGMAKLLLAKWIRIPWPRMRLPKPVAVMGALALALLIGIGVAILVARRQPPSPVRAGLVGRTTIPAGTRLDCSQGLVRIGVRMHSRLRAPDPEFQLVSCHDANMIPHIPELGPPSPPAFLLQYARKGERGSQDDLIALYAGGGFSIRLAAADVALDTMERRNPSSGTQRVRLAGREGWLSWRDERRWWVSNPPNAVATRIKWRVRPPPHPLTATLYGYFDRSLALRLGHNVAEALSAEGEKSAALEG